MIKSIKIGDKFRGRNGIFVVTDIYVAKMKAWVLVTHLESGQEHRLHYDYFNKLELTKLTKTELKKLAMQQELKQLLNNGDPRICDLDRIDKLTNMLEED